MRQLYLAAFSAMLLLSSCKIIGGIFKAGVWTGVLIVIAIVGIIVFVLYSLFKKSNQG